MKTWMRHHGGARRGFGIKVKIFAYLLGFCAVLLGMLWVAQVVFLDNIYRRIKVHDIKNNMATVVRGISDVDLNMFIQQVSAENDISVNIIKLDYSTSDLVAATYSSESTPATYYSEAKPTEYSYETKPAENYSEAKPTEYSYETKPAENYSEAKPAAIEVRGVLREMLQNGGEYIKFNTSEVTVPQSGGVAQGSGYFTVAGAVETMSYNKLVRNGDDTYLVTLRTGVSPLKTTVKTIRVALLYITAGMILFALMFSEVIARYISHPIVNINAAAKILADNNYQARFDGYGYREVRELSDTLNYAAEQLSKSDKLKRELLANVTHDLRTPLTLISGYAEVMRDLPEENNSANAQIIIDETQRLNGLINDVLEISKLQSGEVKLDVCQFNLTDSIRKIVADANNSVKRDGGGIHFECDGDVYVAADRMRIQQAFNNLLINALNVAATKQIAVRQTVDAGVVKIEMRAQNHGGLMSVQPCGDGSGDGLRLSAAKAVIQLHGGQCGAGQGGFWFTLKLTV